MPFVVPFAVVLATAVVPATSPQVPIVAAVAAALAEQPLAGHVLAIALDDLPVPRTLQGEPAAVFDPAT